MPTRLLTILNILPLLGRVHLSTPLAQSIEGCALWQAVAHGPQKYPYYSRVGKFVSIFLRGKTLVFHNNAWMKKCKSLRVYRSPYSRAIS